MRAAARLAGLILLFLLCVGPHLLSKLVFGRSRWPRRFLAAAAWIVGARVRVTGEPLRPHSLILANHTSWIDVLVISAATGCRFVSKDQLGHGFVHWLANQDGTIYIRRSDRRDSKNQALTIAKALEEPQPVALFPEGTTGPELLPFRSALLEAVTYASKEVEVRPVALDFGEATAEIAWHDERGVDNVKRVLGRKGTLPVTVRLLPPLERTDRKHMAEAARHSIGGALAASSSAAGRL